MVLGNLIECSTGPCLELCTKWRLQSENEYKMCQLRDLHPYAFCNLVLYMWIFCVLLDTTVPPLESREPRNIVLSKFCSEIDRKFNIRPIACVYGTLDHIDCLKYHSCCLVSPVFVDCNILIGQKCPLMHQSELLMVIIQLYFQQNYGCSAKISALICSVLSKFSTF